MSRRAKDWADRWIEVGIRRLDDEHGRRASPSTAALLRELAKLTAEKEATAVDEKRPNLARQGTVEHCWGHYGTLAKRVGCSEATVPRALDWLNDAGLVLRTARHDRRGWVTCTDFFLNVNDEPIEQFATRLDLVWRRVPRSANAESEPEPHFKDQEEPRLNLILQPPEPQNEILHIRKSQESEPGGGSTLAKTSAKEAARPKARRPAKAATRQLPMGAALNSDIEFAERNISVNQYGELEIGEELRERLRRVASDEQIDLVLPRALANAQGSRNPIRLLEQINRALSYARQDDIRAASRGRFGARPQRQRSAADEESIRKTQEARAAAMREEEAQKRAKVEADERALQEARRRRGLGVNEVVGKLNQAVREGTLGSAHQPAEQQRKTANDVA